jgi:hypothetical protein
MVDRFPYGDFCEGDAEREAAYDRGWEQGRCGEPLAPPPEIAADLDLALQFELGYKEGKQDAAQENKLPLDEDDFPDEPSGNLAHVPVQPVRLTQDT